MSEDARSRERALLNRAHDGVAAALVGCRPLVWDEVPSDPSVIAYDTLMAAGLVLLAIEALGGMRGHWRLSGRGALLGALLALLGVAMMHSPLPAQAWGFYAQLLCDGALAWYLLQVVPGRARLLTAALAGGLVVELAISALQAVWVLPAMAREQAAHRLDVPPALAPLVAERIANGGVFGTFTQANALAGYLLVASPPILAAWWRVSPPRRAWTMVAWVVAACAAVGPVAVLTSSKAAYLAIAAALGLAVCLRLPRVRTRAALLAAAVALAAIAVCIGPVRHLMVRTFHDSAHVRLGYWAAGCRLALAHPLAGTGLCGYRDDADRVLPVWGQYSSHAHSEPIEAASEAGALAGAALMALLGWLAIGRRDDAPAEQDPTGRPDGGPGQPSPPWLVAGAVGAAIAYMGMLGLLDGNVSWWPGGHDWLGTMWWSLAVAVVATVAVRWCACLGRPPPLACAIGLGALALHCLVDYDLHAGGVAGTAVVVAVLAGGTAWRLGAPRPGAPGGDLADRPARMRALAVVPATVAAVVVAGGVAWWGWLSARERAASQVVEAIRQGLAKGAPTKAQQDNIRDIATDLGVTQSAPSGMFDALIDRTNELAWADYPLRLDLLALQPPGPGRVERTQALARAWPDCAAVERLWSEDEREIARNLGGAAAADHWHAALAHMRAAVVRSPWSLPMRDDQVLLLHEAAAALPLERIGLVAAASADTAEVARLRPVVDWTNRDR